MKETLRGLAKNLDNLSIRPCRLEEIVDEPDDSGWYEAMKLKGTLKPFTRPLMSFWALWVRESTAIFEKIDDMNLAEVRAFVDDL